jgi:hypothetical protein
VEALWNRYAPPADALALTGPPVVIETDGDGDDPTGSAFAE